MDIQPKGEHPSPLTLSDGTKLTYSEKVVGTNRLEEYALPSLEMTQPRTSEEADIIDRFKIIVFSRKYDGDYVIVKIDLPSNPLSVEVSTKVLDGNSVKIDLSRDKDRSELGTAYYNSKGELKYFDSRYVGGENPAYWEQYKEELDDYKATHPNATRDDQEEFENELIERLYPLYESTASCLSLNVGNRTINLYEDADALDLNKTSDTKRNLPLEVGTEYSNFEDIFKIDEDSETISVTRNRFNEQITVRLPKQLSPTLWNDLTDVRSHKWASESFGNLFQLDDTSQD